MPMTTRTMFVLAVAYLATIAHLTVGSPVPSENFPHSSSLAKGGAYHMFWKYDAKTITFEVHVETKGYVGFGISPNGGMKNSDVVIGWVKDGKAYFQDRFAEGKMMPTVDPSQDWELLEGKETESHTVLKFRRNLGTCDNRDLTIGEGTTRVIWSYHSEDPPSEDRIPYHEYGRRGVKSIYLLQPVMPKPNIIPSDKIELDFLNPNVTVPAKSTTYWCQGFKLPDKVARKHHAVKMEVVVQPGNENLVHHLLLYICTVPKNQSFHGFGGDCIARNMAVGYYGCRQKIVYAWAVGGSPLYLPTKAGLPIGGDSGSYFLLETHYDNPQNMLGVQDGSGVRFTVTPSLRKNEAAIMMMGMALPPLIVPPHYESFRSRHICPSNCLSEHLPDEGIKVFASILHTHLLGYSIQVYHFRDGMQLETDLGTDISYDFDYQEFRPFQKEIIVMKRDTLVIDCVYKSSDMKKVTWGGLGTYDEMCLSFLMYYPATSLHDCFSTVLPQSLISIAGKIDLGSKGEVIYPEAYKNTSWDELMSTKVNWNEQATRARFQKLILESDQYYACPKKSSKARGENNNGLLTAITNVKPKQPLTPRCEVSSTAGSLTAKTTFLQFLLVALVAAITRAI